MRVLCLNTWGGRLLAPLLAYLPRSGADILCLQEVVSTPDSPADWLDYHDGGAVLPQRARLFDEIAAALPDHRGIFCAAASGPLWHGDRPVMAQWGIATFVRRGLAVAGQVQGFIHKDFAARDFGAHPRSRNAHGLRVWDDDAGRMRRVLHLHGLRDPVQGKIDTPERDAQVRRVLALAQALGEAAEPLLICGDFNVEPGSRTFAALQAAGLQDLVTGGGHPGTRTSHYAKPGRFADYAFASGPVAGFEVVRDPEVSDHCPLLIDL